MDDGHYFLRRKILVFYDVLRNLIFRLLKVLFPKAFRALQGSKIRKSKPIFSPSENVPAMAESVFFPGFVEV